MGLLSGILQRLRGGRPAGGGGDTGPGPARRAKDVGSGPAKGPSSTAPRDKPGS